MEQYPSDNFIPQREPNEVTLEYVAEPKPYVAYYVQDCPLPGRKPETAAQEPPAKTCRKGHRGVKVSPSAFHGSKECSDSRCGTAGHPETPWVPAPPSG